MSMLLATLLALLVGFACPRGWLWAEPVVPESQSVRTDQECSRPKASALRCKWFITAFLRLC